MKKKAINIKPIHKKKIPEIIIAQLKSLIDSGEISPGDKLPTERELSEMLNVSRPSLREALRSLSLLGVLDNSPGKGTFLKASPNQWPIEPFIIFSLESGNLLNMLEARHELEIIVVSFAAKRRNKSDLKKMKETLDKMKSNINNLKEYMNSELLFHKAITKASKNPVIIEFMAMLYRHLEGIRRTVYESLSNNMSDLKVDSNRDDNEHWASSSPSFLENNFEDHELIYECILKGDEKNAKQAMKKHMQLQYFKKILGISKDGGNKEFRNDDI
jgi:GntR family transcriptional repressor for pyruvate dehydrogenase complex